MHGIWQVKTMRQRFKLLVMFRKIQVGEIMRNRALYIGICVSIWCVFTGSAALYDPQHVPHNALVIDIYTRSKNPFKVFGDAIRAITDTFSTTSIENLLLLPLDTNDVMPRWRELAEGLREFFGAQDTDINGFIMDMDTILGTIQVGYKQFLKPCIADPLRKTGVYGIDSRKVPWDQVLLTVSAVVNESDLVRRNIEPVRDRVIERIRRFRNDWYNTCLTESCRIRKDIIILINGKLTPVVDRMFKDSKALQAHVRVT